MKENNTSMEFNVSSTTSPPRTTIVVDAIQSFTANATAKVPVAYDTWSFQRPDLWVLAPISILIASCLLLNLTIVVVIASQRSLHKPANAYICSLACLDFLDGCIPMVTAAIRTVIPEYPLAIGFCVAVLVSEPVVKASALNHLLLLSYDRYCAVLYPLKYSMPNRKLYIALQIAGAYVVALIAWSPPAVLFTRVMKGGFCYFALPLNYDLVYFVSTSVAGYSAFVYFYVRCIWGIRTQFFRVRPNKGNGDGGGGGGGIKVRISDRPKTSTSSLSNKKNTVEFIEISTQYENTTTVTSIGTSGQEETLPPSRSSTFATTGPRMQQQQQQERGTSDQANKRRNDITRSLRNVGVYVLVFSASYVPYATIRIIGQVCFMSKRVCFPNVLYWYLLSVSDWLLYAHSSVHPALYMATQREFRVALRALVRKLRKFVCR